MIIENKKRPVEFKETSGNILRGLFHQWGTDILESEYSVTQFSTGICEDEDGNIHEVAPSKIKFTDK